MYVEKIERLKQKLAEQNVSVLVGAGFSKNCDKRFPSWKDLMKDLALELFSDRIELEYKMMKDSRKKSQGLSLKKFREAQIELLIKEQGYLKIVSTFIKKRGYEEAIATYIEERVPYLVDKGDSCSLAMKQKGKIIEEAITLDSLSTHNKLIRLPWANIYTTNYDNLLEFSCRFFLGKDLIQRIDSVKSELETRQKDLQRKEHELAEVQNQITSLESVQKETLPDAKPESFTDFSRTTTYFTNLDKAQSARITLNGDLFRLKRVIQGLNEKLQKFENLLNEVPTPVVHSSELALKQKRNVIKLHGTLRIPPHEGYEFDNDPHNHYIISQEHFDTYPSKHSAFTQLMRISLLRESFCLIGFSGEDPNFYAWITWVREVITKARQPKETDKIFFIDTSAYGPSVEKSLFCRNHNIAYIPILHPECIDYLETQLNRKIKNKESKQEVLESFLDFLGDANYHNKVAVSAETLSQEDFKDFWNSIPRISLLDKTFDSETFFSNVKFSNHLALISRIPVLKSPYVSNVFDLMVFANYHWPKLTSNEAKINFFKILGSAINHTLIPASPYIPSFDFLLQDAKSITGAGELFDLLKVKELVWKGANIQKTKIQAKQDWIIQELSYYKLLSLAFQFDFSKLEKQLNDWQAVGPWVMKKAGLLSLFNLPAAITILKENRQPLHQDELYRHKHLNYFAAADDWHYDSRASRDYVRRLEAEKLIDYDENFDAIIDQYNKPTIRYAPYNEGKFSLNNHELRFDREGREKFIFFGLLIELGLPLSVGNRRLHKPEHLYPIFNLTFEVYPDVVLFFALQDNDAKLLRRLAQDYAYSAAIEDRLDWISEKLQRALKSKSTPEKLKENILTFLSEIIIAVHPSRWEETFLLRWRSKLEDKTLFEPERPYRNEEYFIDRGLRLIKSRSVIRQVVHDCLANAKDENSISNAVSYLYELGHNKNLKGWKKSGLDAKLHQLIERTIRVLLPKYPSAIFIIANLKVFMSKKNEDDLVNILRNLDYSKIENERIFPLIVFFSKADKKLFGRIRPAIVNHKKVWYSGINEKEKTRSSDTQSFMDFERLTKSTDFKQGIEWSTDEIRVIYTMLTSELSKISNVVTNDRDSFVSYEFILEAMIAFLERHPDELLSQASYQYTVEQCRALYRRTVGYNSIEDGLQSTTHSTVVLASSELMTQLYRNKDFSQHQRHIDILITRVVMRLEPGLGACMQYVANLFTEFKDSKALRAHQSSLFRIIASLSDNIPVTIDHPFVEEKLVMVAQVLDHWKVKHPKISEYLNKVKSSRYQNVRQLGISSAIADA